MMNVSLTINGTVSELALILASLPNGVSVSAAPVAGAIPPMPLNPSSVDDDDNDGGVAAVAGQVDNSGLPWDARIHSETPTLTSKGAWRAKRGVDKALVTQVEAELRAQSPAPVPAPMAMPTVPLAPLVAPTIAPPPLAAPVPVPMPAPVVVPPMPAPEPVAVASPAAEGLDIAGFMQHIDVQMRKLNPATNTPLIDAAYLTGITAEISAAFAPQGVPPLTVITDVGNNPALITYAVQLMQRDGRW